MERYHDRVSDTFYGERGEKQQAAVRRRIFWICENARGESVLDVGCSQGIAPILMGRAGLRVTGLDIDETNINFAREALAKEEEGARERVRFLCGDFLAYTPGDGVLYDTVIISEVLEHLDEPERFLTRAKGMLAEGGRLIVTVPFGVDRFPDHKAIYFLSNAYGLLSAAFAVREVMFFDHWLGFICEKTDAPWEREPDAALFAKEEEALCGVWNDLLDDKEKKAAYIKTLQERAEKAQAVKTQVQEKLIAERASKAEIKEKLIAERASKAEIKEKLIAERANKAEIKENLIAERASKAEIKEKLIAERASKAEIKEKLTAERADKAEIKEKLIAEREQRDKVKEALEGARAALATAKENTAALSVQNAALSEKCEKLSRRESELTQIVRFEKTARADAEYRLSRTWGVRLKKIIRKMIGRE